MLVVVVVVAVVAVVVVVASVALVEAVATAEAVVVYASPYNSCVSTLMVPLMALQDTLQKPLSYALKQPLSYP